MPIEEILSHCAHTAGRQALAKIRATAWAGQGVRFDRLFTGGALNPGGGKVDPPGSVEGDGADDDHDEDEPVHSLPLGLSGFHSHQVLPDSDDSPDDGTVEAMNQCPGGGVLGCQDPRAELPTEVAVEAPEETLVSATDEPQRPRGRG